MVTSFAHHYSPAATVGRAPLLLLHGTGGDENDLVPLGRALSPGAALVSPRGKVLERGMPRFFTRLAEGVFDPVEVRQRADELADFVVEARQAYGLEAPIAVGFSNGANIAAVMMMLRPGLLGGAILLRPMLVLDEPAARRAHASVLMLSGASDPIVPLASARALAVRLAEAGALVDHQVLPGSHQLTSADMARAKAWIEESGREAPPQHDEDRVPAA